MAKTQLTNQLSELRLLTSILFEIPWSSRLLTTDVSDKSDRFKTLMSEYNKTYPESQIELGTPGDDADIVQIIMDKINQNTTRN